MNSRNLITSGNFANFFEGNNFALKTETLFGFLLLKDGTMPPKILLMFQSPHDKEAEEIEKKALIKFLQGRIGNPQVPILGSGLLDSSLDQLDARANCTDFSSDEGARRIRVFLNLASNYPPACKKQTTDALMSIWPSYGCLQVSLAELTHEQILENTKYAILADLQKKEKKITA